MSRTFGLSGDAITGLAGNDYTPSHYRNPEGAIHITSQGMSGGINTERVDIAAAMACMENGKGGVSV